jgi:hypothetical protein
MRRCCLFATVVALSINCTTWAQPQRTVQRQTIPKAWDDSALAGWHVPLAAPGAEPIPLTADQFYRLPELKIYRSYPVYAPGKEPAGYLEKLKQAEPELVFDATRLKADADWIQAGELVFEAPVTISAIETEAYINDPGWYRDHNVPIAGDGTVPFYRYVVREKGRVEIGTLSCGNCHTRVLPDGAVIKGAQGNFPRAQSRTYSSSTLRSRLGDAPVLKLVRSVLVHDYGTPWLNNDLNMRLDEMSLDDIITAMESAPAGVVACHNSSLFSPVQIPDLIGIRERKYLDHTGHVLHRDIGDLMRFEAFIQGNTLTGFGGYTLLPPVPGFVLEERMSDAQLYALARYLYSLQPPRNPNRPSTLSSRGGEIFSREGCGRCHTPPLYSNNTLTLALGFTPPPEHLTKYAITQVCVGTDATLALRTRKGTGYYKVPSLKGVWYRGPFEHNGSVATLEDWFDPARLREDYIPTGFKGVGVKTRAIKGHEFGIRLPSDEKAALIAFLRTL